MCSPLIDNSNDGSLCEIIIFFKKRAHTAPLIAFLPDSQNIQFAHEPSPSIFSFVVVFVVFFCFVLLCFALFCFVLLSFA